MLPPVPPPWEPLFVPFPAFDFVSPVPVLLLVAYNTMNTIHKTVRTRTRASKTFSSRDRFFLKEIDSPFSILSCASCCSFGSSPLSIFLLYWAEDMAMEWIVLVGSLADVKPLELLSLETPNRNKFRKVS